MNNPHVLVLADTAEAVDYLTDVLLPQSGHVATRGDDFSPPPPCDVILVDISLLRSVNPLVSLKAQRRMGCNAPAILFAPRLTEQMATEVFPLGIREFVNKPVEDAVRLEKLAELVSRVREEQDQAALHEHLAQAQDDLAQRLEEIKTLSRIIRAIGTLSDLDTMLAHVVESGVYLTRAEEGAIFLRDDDSGQLLMCAQQGMGASRAEAIRQPSTDSDAIVVFQTGQPVIKGGETQHKVKTGHLANALINVPIILGSDTLGVLAVYNRQSSRSFDDSDQIVLGSLADFAAIALDKINLLSLQDSRVDTALEKSNRVFLHAQTLYDPIDGIESQVETLLAGGFGLLAEKQHSAVTRIRQATTRLKEVIEFIREEIEQS